jgi:acyl carrier protein
MTPTQRSGRAVLAEISGRAANTISSDDRLSDLGLDSLDRLVLAVLVEQRCGLALSDAALIRIATVGDLDRQLEPEREPA